MRESRGGQGVLTPTPLKNHRAIGFLSNTGPDLLKNHKTTKPAFNVGQSLTCQWCPAFSSIWTPSPPHQLKTPKNNIVKVGSLVCDVFLCFCDFPIWCPASGVVFDCIDS